MSKKSATSKTAKAQVPEPAQLKAIERLMGARDYPQAAARARTLVQRFPHHGGARRLLVDSLVRAEDLPTAALAAYRWAEDRPNTLQAQESLLELARRCGHWMLAERVAGRVRDLGGKTPGSPMSDEALAGMLEQPDGSSVALEAMEQFDIGKLLLEGRDFRGAAQALAGLDLTPARNNRALALFHLARIDEALAAAREAWERDPGNLVGLEFLLQLHLYRDDETDARGLFPRLAQAEARRPEDALAQVTGLLLLQEDQAAWDAWERTREADWAGYEPPRLQALRLHAAAGAASRCGRTEQAENLWGQAQRLFAGLPGTGENLAALRLSGQSPRYPAIFQVGQVIPLGWWLGQTAAASQGPGAYLGALDASDRYLEAVLLGGAEELRLALALTLMHRLKSPASFGAPVAAAVLWGLARLPVGTGEERIGYLVALRQADALPAGAVPQYWDGGQLRDLDLAAVMDG